MHPVDEEFLRTAQVDLGDRAVSYAIAARRQRAANIKLEVGRRAGGRLNVSDLPGRIEAVLGQDGDFIGVDGGIVAIERAGNLNNAGRVRSPRPSPLSHSVWPFTLTVKLRPCGP